MSAGIILKNFRDLCFWLSRLEVGRNKSSSKVHTDGRHTQRRTRTQTHTQQQDLSPTHIPKQNTHCVIAPFVFFSHPPSFPASTSHTGSPIPTLVPTSVTQPPITLWFLAFAAVQNLEEILHLHFAKYEGLFPSIRIILSHTAQQHLGPGSTLVLGSTWRSIHSCLKLIAKVTTLHR